MDKYNDSWVKTFKRLFYRNKENYKRYHWVEEKLMLSSYELVFNYMTPIKGMDILDIGCGCGDFFEYMYRKFGIDRSFFGNIKGVDPVSEFINEANNNKALDGIDFEVSNILNYTDGNRYDFVSCIGAIQFVEDVELNIRKLLSLLKPNGLCYINTLKTFEKRDGAADRVIKYKKFYHYNADYLESMIKGMGLFGVERFGISFGGTKNTIDGTTDFQNCGIVGFLVKSL